jgi:protein PsiE
MSALEQAGKKALTVVENLGLAAIAISTVIAFIAEINFMIENRAVTLGDLLLMFIYLEVLAMVSIYIKTGKLPIRIPIYIAIVALARHMILDMKSMDSWEIIAVAIAALVFALSVLAIRYGHVRLSYPDDENKGKNTAEDGGCDLSPLPNLKK